MVFDMGETRPNGGAAWLDPFAAYRILEKKKQTAGSKPIPIRPVNGKVLWREYASLFLVDPQRQHLRPAIVGQYSRWMGATDSNLLSVRCVGLRTDMKAKIYEWQDSEFDLPVAILNDPDASILIRQSIALVEDIGRLIAGIVRLHWRADAASILNHLMPAYWDALAAPFRQLVGRLGTGVDRQAVRLEWAQVVATQTRHEFGHHIDLASETGRSIAKAALAQEDFGKKLSGRIAKYRKED